MSLLAPPAARFGQVFPFHLVVDRALHIVQAGPAASRLLGESLVGTPLWQAFTLERPVMPTEHLGTLEALAQLSSQLVSLRHDVTGLGLRGQLVADDDGHGFLLMSPVLRSTEDFARQGLKLADLPRHDAVLDVLMMLQTQALHLQDLKRLTETLMRQRAELRLSEERFRRAFDDVVVGMALVSAEGDLLRVNPAFTALFGRPAATLVGTPFASQAAPPFPQYVARHVTALVAGQARAASFELRPVEATVRDRWLAVTASVVCTEPGTPVEIVLQVQDVTTARELERRQKEMVKHLLELNQAKDDFVSNASHEIRTPLAALKGTAYLLKSDKVGELNPVQTELVGRLGGQIDRLDRLVDDMLDLATIQAGSTRFSLAAQRVEPLLAAACADHQALMAERGITLALEAPAELQAVLDPDRFAQVLGNLLTNAAKFTPAGGRVTLSATRRGDEVRLAVADTGPGVPPADRERVFEKFVQLEGGLARSAGGAGLGLAICKAIVEEGLRGRIWIEAAEGGGCAVVVSLPGA